MKSESINNLGQAWPVRHGLREIEPDFGDRDDSRAPMIGRDLVFILQKCPKLEGLKTKLIDGVIEEFIEALSGDSKITKLELNNNEIPYCKVKGAGDLLARLLKMLVFLKVLKLEAASLSEEDFLTLITTNPDKLLLEELYINACVFQIPSSHYSEQARQTVLDWSS